MRITHFAVKNYKSLRGIRLTPRSLNVIVGANAAGKSNLADSIDFVSEVCRHGLEVAVARKGGYENIAYRKMRRAKGGIAVDIGVDVAASEIERYLYAGPKKGQVPSLRFRHRFAFAARGYSIRAEFEVIGESVTVSALDEGDWLPLLSLRRQQDGGMAIALLSEEADSAQEVARRRSLAARVPYLTDIGSFMPTRQLVAPTDLFMTTLGRYTPVLDTYAQSVSAVRVFQISPTKSREFGVPTPRPELDGSGENLPAVVDLLHKRNPEQWKQVMQAMRAIVPALRDIEVDYTSSRTLGLFFQEDGFGRPWSVGEVSDGTIQTLALLVAIFDSRYSALVLEEPENSVHPWIIRHVLDACKAASRQKQIILTTHSPIVMNAVRPEQLWVMWRVRGESHLAPVTQLDPEFLHMWEGGAIPTFDYLDSGALPKALPPLADEFNDEDEG